MSKLVSKSLKWNQVVPLACAVYNILLNEHSKENTLFLMFGRDPVVLLNSLLTHTVRYLGANENLLSLETLMNIHQLIARNKLKGKEMPKPLYLIENLVGVILFYLRITPKVSGALGIPETIE